MKDNIFNVDNCYGFIPPRKTSSKDGTKISEWIMDLEDLELLDNQLILKNMVQLEIEDSSDEDESGELIFTNGQNFMMCNWPFPEQAYWKIFNNNGARIGMFDRDLQNKISM